MLIQCFATHCADDEKHKDLPSCFTLTMVLIGSYIDFVRLHQAINCPMFKLHYIALTVAVLLGYWRGTSNLVCG